MSWEIKHWAEFYKELDKLTEEDAGFINEKNYYARHYQKNLTLHEYKDILEVREMDAVQLIRMGR